jgi:hypothetical protein
MSAAVSISLRELSDAPSQVAWYRERAALLRARERITAAETAELDAIERHLHTMDRGVAPIAHKARVREAKAAYHDAVLRGDHAAASAAKDTLARLQRDEKIAREVRRAAPAREALRAARDAASTQAAELEAEQRAAEQLEADGVTKEIAAALLVLHRLRLTVPSRVPSRHPASVWAAAVALAAGDVKHSPAHLARPLVDLLQYAAL